MPQCAYVEILGAQEVWRAQKRRKSCSRCSGKQQASNRGDFLNDIQELLNQTNMVWHVKTMHFFPWHNQLHNQQVFKQYHMNHIWEPDIKTCLVRVKPMHSYQRNKFVSWNAKKMPSGQIQFHWHSQLRSQQVFKAYHVSFFQPFVGNRCQDLFNAMCQTNAL